MTKEKVFISEADQYLFAQGTHYDIYKKLGAHLSTEDGVQGVYFGVWAPNAAQVNVIGTFNEWNEESHPMQKLGEGGIWGLFVPGVEEGTMYKFLIYARDGRRLYKADPFANYAEYRPGTASIVTDITGFDWKDSKWMEARARRTRTSSPTARSRTIPCLRPCSAATRCSPSATRPLIAWWRPITAAPVITSTCPRV